MSYTRFAVPASCTRLYIVPALLSLVLLATTAGCAGVEPIRADGEVQTPASFDHSAFDRVLTAYVDEEGLVDYKRLKEDDALRPYLQALANTDPSDLDESERLAFWINAYNALTIKLIVDKYPTESILDLKPAPGPFIPNINSPFQLDVSEVGGAVRTLDEIEHGIIRERFEEPRIHFALVCAAMSCPPLRREAYTGTALDRQLDDQADIFLHNENTNRVPAGERTIELSPIFKWFREDFGGSKESTQRFVAPYFEGAIRDKLAEAAYEVNYTDYDWSLNDQARTEAAQDRTAARSSSE